MVRYVLSVTVLVALVVRLRIMLGVVGWTLVAVLISECRTSVGDGVTRLLRR